MTMPPPQGQPPSPDPRIDLYIDGLLAGDDLARFEADLARSPALREELALQQRIDAEVRGVFAYDESRAVDPRVAPVAGRIDDARAAQSRRLRLMGIAAVLLLGVALVFRFNAIRSEQDSRSIDPASVYAIVNEPTFICKDDKEFADAVAKQLGSPLILAQTPGITALGWAYGDGYMGRIVGDKTLVLITDVRGSKVLVFMDRLRDDRTLPEPGPETGLRLFRREAGRLVLYEVTPLEKPEVIDRLVPPK